MIGLIQSKLLASDFKRLSRHGKPFGIFDANTRHGRSTRLDVVLKGSTLYTTGGTDRCADAASLQ
jgi:hypothetical protein